MVAHLFIGLVLITAASLLITQGKRRKIWAILLLLALCSLSLVFIRNLNISDNMGFMYQWLPYSKLQADFNISSSVRMQQMLSQLIGLLGIIILFNIINNDESYSMNVSVLNVMSFIMLILLASSHDFFQLMFASSLLSIIAFYLPDDIIVRRKFLFSVFFAETAGFIALSIIYNTTSSISISDLPYYVSAADHKDFVAILLLFSLGIKVGLFMFGSHYTLLFTQPSNRIAGIAILSLPFSALIILNKLSVLINSPTYAEIVKYWCMLGGGVLLLFSVTATDINRKLLYIVQSVYSGLFYVIYSQPEKLYSLSPIVLLLIILTMSLVWAVAGFLLKQDDAAVAGPLFKLLPLLLIGYGGIFVIMNRLIALFPQFLPFFYFYIAIIGIDLRQLFYNRKSLNLKKLSASITSNTLTVIVIISLSIALWCIFKPWKDSNILLQMAGLTALVFIAPLGWLLTIGKKAIWQYSLFEMFYNYLLLMPLKFFGRVLWLAFDFMFIERGVISASTSTGELVSDNLRLLQSINMRSWLFWTIAGICGLAIYIGVAVYD